MSGCCSGANRVTVEVDYLIVGDKTCDRCESTIDSARTATARAAADLAGMNVAVELVERPFVEQDVERSNRVRVNGVPVEQWLGGQVTATECPSCSDLLGRDVCCPGIEVDGQSFDALSAEVISEAILRAAGMVVREVGAAVPAASAEADADPSGVVITLVTSDACG